MFTSFKYCNRNKYKSLCLLVSEYCSTSNGYSNGFTNVTNGYSVPSSAKQTLPDYIEAMKLTVSKLSQGVHILFCTCLLYTSRCV